MFLFPVSDTPRWQAPTLLPLKTLRFARETGCLAWTVYTYIYIYTCPIMLQKATMPLRFSSELSSLTAYLQLMSMPPELSRTKACIQSTQSTSIFTKDNLTKRFTICSMHTASQLSKPDAIKHTKSEELMTVSDVCSILWEGGNIFCPLLYLQWAFHRLARITIPLTNRVFCGQARPDVRFENTEILPNQMRSLHCKALEGISRSQKALPLCGESFNIPEQEQVIKSFFWFAGACERERWSSCTSLCICNRNAFYCTHYHTPDQQLLTWPSSTRRAKRSTQKQV